MIEFLAHLAGSLLHVLMHAVSAIGGGGGAKPHQADVQPTLGSATSPDRVGDGTNVD